MFHYEVTPQQRQQIAGGRSFVAVAPLCNTGDGHYWGGNPDRWSGPMPKVDCPACCERKTLLDKRDRDRATWAS